MMKPVALILLVLSVVGCTAAAVGRSPAIGAPMPGFTLTDVAGKTHTLEQYKGSIVVLDFMSQECPYSRGVDASLPELVKAYADKGVVVLGIDSHKSTTPEQMKAYAEKAGLTHALLKDTGNSYADAAGATRTPEFFVVDKDGKVAYHGAYDDRKVPDKAGTVSHVRNAIDDLLAGRAVQTPEVDAWGCTIKRAQ